MSGQVKSCHVRSSHAMSGQVMPCQLRSAQDRSGQIRSGQIRTGQFRTGQVKSGQVRTNLSTYFEWWSTFVEDIIYVPLAGPLLQNILKTYGHENHLQVCYCVIVSKVMVKTVN